MIIYNVTINIDESVHDDWLRWMKEIHIPEVMATGCFLENKICQILAESQGGISYSIQYTCEGRAQLNEYQEKYATQLQAEHTERYKDKFGAFRTLLKVVHQC